MRYNTGEEATHYFFEIAKRFTTLDTAAILIYLAMSNQFSDRPLWWPLGFFVVSAIGATVSMLATGMRGISSNRFYVGNAGMVFALVGFFVGLVYSIFVILSG